MIDLRDRFGSLHTPLGHMLFHGVIFQCAVERSYINDRGSTEQSNGGPISVKSDGI